MRLSDPNRQAPANCVAVLLVQGDQPTENSRGRPDGLAGRDAKRGDSVAVRSRRQSCEEFLLSILKGLLRYLCAAKRFRPGNQIESARNLRPGRGGDNRLVLRPCKDPADLLLAPSRNVPFSHS